MTIFRELQIQGYWNFVNKTFANRTFAHILPGLSPIGESPLYFCQYTHGLAPLANVLLAKVLLAKFPLAQIHVFLNPDSEKNKTLDSNPVGSRREFFSPISGILCIHEQIKDQDFSYSLATQKNANV
jgi:hypothetical protein